MIGLCVGNRDKPSRESRNSVIVSPHRRRVCLIQGLDRSGARRIGLQRLVHRHHVLIDIISTNRR